MDYVHNAWLGEKMKKDYQTKDIKATSNKKIEDVEIVEEDGLFYFVWEGNKQGFTKLENAKIALNRVKGE
jgi:uncharacterized membrane protein